MTYTLNATVITMFFLLVNLLFVESANGNQHLSENDKLYNEMFLTDDKSIVTVKRKCDLFYSNTNTTVHINNALVVTKDLYHIKIIDGDAIKTYSGYDNYYCTPIVHKTLNVIFDKGRYRKRQASEIPFWCSVDKDDRFLTCITP